MDDVWPTWVPIVVHLSGSTLKRIIFTLSLDVHPTQLRRVKENWGRWTVRRVVWIEELDRELTSNLKSIIILLYHIVTVEILLCRWESRSYVAKCKSMHLTSYFYVHTACERESYHIIRKKIRIFCIGHDFLRSNRINAWVGPVPLLPSRYKVIPIHQLETCAIMLGITYYYYHSVGG